MNKHDYDVIVGIDIGLHGGISFFDTMSDELGMVKEMPIMKVTNKAGKEKNVIDLDKLFFLLEIPKVHKESALVVYEDVHAFPGQGVVAVGTLLEQKGIIRGIAKALGYGELPISPKMWQKSFYIVCPKEIKDKSKRKKWLKNKSLEVAKSSFPEWEIRIANNDGLSDAMLIGKFILNNYL